MADVRLQQFEPRLLRLEMPVQATLGNYFGEATREAVLRFRSEAHLEGTGEVDCVTARRINSEIRQRVPADEGLERLVETVELTRELIEALDPYAENLRAQTERFSEMLEAFTIALDMLRDFDAPDGLGAKVEELLEIGRLRLEELAGSSGEDGSAVSFVVRGRTFSREAVMDCSA